MWTFLTTRCAKKTTGALTDRIRPEDLPRNAKDQSFQKVLSHPQSWHARIAGEANGQHIRLVKFQGPFTWHHHENEDEIFVVFKGRFRLDYRENGSDRAEWIESGEFIIVP